MLSRHNVKKDFISMFEETFNIRTVKNDVVEYHRYSSRDESAFLLFHIFFHILHILVITPSYKRYVFILDYLKAYKMFLPLRSVRL